jgi:hypothetical protein
MAPDAPPDSLAQRSLPMRWVMTGATGLAALLLIALFGRLMGVRSFVFAFNLHFIAMAAAATLDQLWKPRLDGRRFDVSPRELPIYRRLGVVGFMRLLQRIGWTRVMRDATIFDGTRATLASYERATRHSEHAHLCLFLVVLAPMLGAAAQGWWDAFGYLGAMNVGFHLYPVMLQRLQRHRLRALIARMAASDASRRADAGPGPRSPG